MATTSQTILPNSDLQARQRLVDNIGKLTALAKAIHEHIDEENRLLGKALPYADNRYEHSFAALCRTAYGVFECDELHEMGVAYDPASETRVTVLDERGVGPASYVGVA